MRVRKIKKFKKLISEYVTVIIPFYNDIDYIEHSLKSVFNQTYKKYNILIINDGSNQKSYNHILYLKKKYSKLPIKIISTKKNFGTYHSRNIGIKFATGEYLSFLDSDDEWLPDKLEHQIKLIKDKKLNFIHSSYNVYNLNKKIIGIYIARTINYQNLKKSCDVGTSTVLLKTKIAKQFLFRKIKTKEDYVYWLELLKKYKTFYGDKKVVTNYRYRKNSLSHKSILLNLKNGFRVYNEFLCENFLKSIILLFRLSLLAFLKKFQSIFKNVYPSTINLITNKHDLDFSKSFILIALNLAALSYLNRSFTNIKKIYWADGIITKIFGVNLKKLPGRLLLNEIVFPNTIKRIYLCGNTTRKQFNYLKKLTNDKLVIIKHRLPFFNNYNEIYNHKYIIKDNSVVLINISTPKQEIVAENILFQNPEKKLFIFCLGAALAMASGEEKITPHIIYKLNMEWFWRLGKDTSFRLKRLFESFLIFIFRLITGYYNKFIIKFIK